MIRTPELGLTIWNNTLDPYDSQQLGSNFAKVEEHDHTPGKGARIGTAAIADGAVTTAKLSPGVFTDILGDGSVTASKLADLSVSTAKLQDNAVTTAKLGANSVTAAKIEGQQGWQGLASYTGFSAGGRINYYKDSLGFVHMNGDVVVPAGGLPSGTAIGTMPTGFRPVSFDEFVFLFNRVNPSAGATLQIASGTGAIVLYSAAAGSLSFGLSAHYRAS